MPSVFSFDFGHRYIQLDQWAMAFLVYTEDNVFTPEPSAMRVSSTERGYEISADRLACAGLQQSVEGRFHAQVLRVEEGFDCTIDATINQRIKGTTLLLKDAMPAGVPGRDYDDAPCPAEGKVLKYPAQMRLPVFPLRHADGSFTAIASLDEQVRGKTVAVVAQQEKGGRDAVIELHHHEDARQWSTHQRTPTWRVLKTKDPSPLFEMRCALAERHWGLKPWDQREDVPAWMKQVGLVLNLHGMHWTGYIFNTYEQQLDAIRYVAERIEGKRVLAFLAAWDGRYNYNWPAYEADARMGGEAGLAHLVAEAHKLGVHVVPQIGAVSANRRYLPPGLHDCASQDAFGNVYVKEVDWDNDRVGDSYRVNANIGHPGFQRFLLDRTAAIKRKYDFDGIFLDINMSVHNDPRFSLYEGHRDFVRSCHEMFDDFLVFGENWYDGLQPLYPLVHSVIDQKHGMMGRWEQVFDRYCRATYHLIHPAPGAGSTGVYEKGYRTPFIPPSGAMAIPAVSFVDDTLDKHKQAVDERIEAAKAYVKHHGL